MKLLYPNKIRIVSSSKDLNGDGLYYAVLPSTPMNIVSQFHVEIPKVLHHAFNENRIPAGMNTGMRILYPGDFRHEERDELYENDINPIRAIDGNVVLWGNRVKCDKLSYLFNIRHISIPELVAIMSFLNIIANTDSNLLLTQKSILEDMISELKSRRIIYDGKVVGMMNKNQVYFQPNKILDIYKLSMPETEAIVLLQYLRAVFTLSNFTYQHQPFPAFITREEMTL